MASKRDMEQLAKEEADAEQAARLEAEGKTLEMSATPNADTAPVSTTATPAPAPNAELDAIRAQLEAANARNAELTSRLNAEDGRRGGELRTLREMVEQMKAQNQALIDEVKALKTKPADSPAVPVVDDEEEKAYAEHFPNKAKREKAVEAARAAELERIRQEALEAKKKAEALERLTISEKQAAFNATVSSALRGVEGFSNDDFNAWADKTVAGVDLSGVPYTYGQIYDASASAMNAARAITVIEAYKASKATVPATTAAEDTTKPPKPSKESQATPSKSAGAVNTPPVSDTSKDAAKMAARIKELEYKVLEVRKFTPQESAELDQLYLDYEKLKTAA